MFRRIQSIVIRKEETLLKKLQKPTKKKIWDHLGISEEQYKVYNQSGYTAYVDFVEKEQLFANLKNLDFHYSCQYDYQEDRPCQHGSDCCDNDYCRCGVIENAHVTSAPTASSIFNQLKIDPHIISQYYVDRLYFPILC